MGRRWFGIMAPTSTGDMNQWIPRWSTQVVGKSAWTRMDLSSRSSCSRRPNKQELEIMRLCEEMRKQWEFMQVFMQHNLAIYPQKGMTPNIPQSPQWSMFASTLALGPGTQQFITPHTHIPALGDRATPEAGGTGSEPVGTGFVESLSAYRPLGGGSGQSSNHLSGGYP
ncbi:uncharacterized protein [Zea mays]|uniref:uncharacterized protein n=1 Tax=Zea mays TaxID=4577 RepID=UPI0009AA7039|nr:uncharacterized protein LOC109942437 [Zea mays]|eukprot:XP_020400034.1 uncharacterized protein LOC109942437 [Zea mays]